MKFTKQRYIANVYTHIYVYHRDLDKNIFVSRRDAGRSIQSRYLYELLAGKRTTNNNDTK